MNKHVTAHKILDISHSWYKVCIICQGYHHLLLPYDT